MISTKSLRRSYDAAVKGREEGRFFRELREAFENKEVRPLDFSIRECIEEFLPDGRELIQSWNPRHGEGSYTRLSTLIEADAVKTSAFSNISGQIIYNAVLEGFMLEDFVYSRLIPTVPTEFSGEKIAGIGGIGDLAEVVPEAGAYPMVGVQEDWIKTPETLKRGFIVPLTREAAFFDRTGQLIQRCSEVGMYLGVNKEKRAGDCIVDENTTAHRYNRKDLGAVQTYNDNTGDHDWDNLQASNALTDWTDVDAAEQLLNSITDPNTGEPVVVNAKHLVCGKSLERTALHILNATTVMRGTGSTVETIVPGFATTGSPVATTVRSDFENAGPNPVAGLFQVVSSRYDANRRATDTDWNYGDITKAFRYMENFPMATVQAPANSELEFTHDIVNRWKASERGAYATVEPRAMVKCTA